MGGTRFQGGLLAAAVVVVAGCSSGGVRVGGSATNVGAKIVPTGHWRVAAAGVYQQHAWTRLVTDAAYGGVCFAVEFAGVSSSETVVLPSGATITALPGPGVGSYEGHHVDGCGLVKGAVVAGQFALPSTVTFLGRDPAVGSDYAYLAGIATQGARIVLTLNDSTTASADIADHTFTDFYPPELRPTAANILDNAGQSARHCPISTLPAPAELLHADC